MKKISTVMLMTVMAGILITIGLWHVVENVMWLWVIGVGVVGLLEANRIFNKLQFGEIEVEEDKA